MKQKKYIFYIIALLIFIAYLFCADYLFNVVIKTDREAALVKISLPSETKNIKYHIDKAQQVKLKWKEAIKIQGWAFREGVKNKARDVYLVLKGHKETLVYDIKNDTTFRRDVTNHFKIGGDVHSHGFELILVPYRLKEDIYEIGLIIVDEEGKHYQITNQELVKKDRTWTIPGTAVPFRETFTSEQVSLEIKTANKEIRYHIDTYDESKDGVNIIGWGYLDGLNTDDIKHYIVLKTSDKTIIYTSQNQLRKDVTTYFEKSGLDLDHSGFFTMVPKKGLQRGEYQVGLYIVKSDDGGVVYTDKYVTVE